MTRDSARDRVTTELAAHPARTREFKAFIAWCGDRGIQPAPTQGDSQAGELLLLRYIHTQREAAGWSPPYVNSVAGHIARTWIRAGHADPRGLKWDAYMRAANRVAAGPQAPTDAFSETEVVSLTDLVHSNLHTDRRTALAGAILATAIATGSPSPFKDAVGLARRISEVHQGRAVNIGSRQAGSQHRSASVQEATSGVLARYLSLSTGTAEPTSSIEAARRRMSTTLSRLSGVATTRRVKADRESFDTWWSAADQNSRVAVMLHAERPGLAQGIRDLAYFYTGFSFGGRFAELSRLRISWLRHGDDGYTFTIPGNQHKGGLLAIAKGKRPDDLTALVPHAPGHPAHCPACRLSDYLDLRRMAGAGRPGDRVFVGPTGSPLTLRIALQTITRLVSYLPSEGNDTRRMGTRSIRVTAATLAKASGLSLLEVQEIGHWKQIATVERYLRIHDVYADKDLILPIDAPD